jgi:hypothetical protein
MLSMNLYPAGGDLALSPPITLHAEEKKVRQLACARGRGHGGGANRPMIRSPALLTTSLIKAPSLSVLYTEERMCLLCPVRLAYQPPANSTFLSKQTSHQQPASSTFLSEQTSTSHQPPAKPTGC